MSGKKPKTPKTPKYNDLDDDVKTRIHINGRLFDGCVVQLRNKDIITLNHSKYSEIDGYPFVHMADGEVQETWTYQGKVYKGTEQDPKDIVKILSKREYPEYYI